MKQNEFLGYCSVDSGQILLVDPCYLEDWKHGEFAGSDKVAKNSYAQACKITLNKNQGGEMLISGLGSGVVASSGYGDGHYPVYAEYEDGRIKSLTINFF